MKTPREILLARHADASAELDALRRSVVAELKPAESPGWLAVAWRELFWQPRLVWTGLAAVWVFLLGGNIAMRGAAVRDEVVFDQLAEGLRQKRAIYAEFGLVGNGLDAPQIQIPGPRSRLRPMRMDQAAV